MRYLTFQIEFNAIKSILDVAFLLSSLMKEEMAVSGPQRASLLLSFTIKVHLVSLFLSG